MRSSLKTLASNAMGSPLFLFWSVIIAYCSINVKKKAPKSGKNRSGALFDLVNLIPFP
jgi:hypothetical protein